MDGNIKWSLSHMGLVKNNFDGSMETRTISGGVGVVIQDGGGMFFAARCVHVPGIINT